MSLCRTSVLQELLLWFEIGSDQAEGSGDGSTLSLLGRAGNPIKPCDSTRMESYPSTLFLMFSSNPLYSIWKPIVIDLRL